MREYTRILTEQLADESPYKDDIDEEFIRDIVRASPLHDIGKVGIPDGILFSTDKLGEDELDEWKRHTTLGAEILEQAVVRSPEQTFLRMAAVIALCHHERFDGNGYPLRLRASAIPFPARIVAVADVYDSLTSSRSGSATMTALVVKKIIESQSAKRFDPVVVDAFRRRFEDFLQVPESVHDELATIDVAGSLKT
jgi:HD-GYP domain-containing protein (c-di-GMP phosphodiesterase class II)